MKIKNITDIDGFFKVIDSCQGKVELITGEGDRLNLKSKLCQYVSLTRRMWRFRSLSLSLTSRKIQRKLLSS